MAKRVGGSDFAPGGRRRQVPPRRARLWRGHFRSLSAAIGAGAGRGAQSGAQRTRGRGGWGRRRYARGGSRRRRQYHRALPAQRAVVHGDRRGLNRSARDLRRGRRPSVPARPPRSRGSAQGSAATGARSRRPAGTAASLARPRPLAAGGAEDGPHPSATSRSWRRGRSTNSARSTWPQVTPPTPLSTSSKRSRSRRKSRAPGAAQAATTSTRLDAISPNAPH